MTTHILLLASNPQGTEQLRLNPEIREIEDALEKGKHSDRFFVRPRVAVRVEDLQQRLQKSAPRIVHFCGHGTGSQGLVLETDTGQQQLLDTQAIADLFQLFKNQVECVVLNACYSQVQATEISKHINYVIGTKKSIRDDAAIAFSKGFYEALGNGETIHRAFEFGQNRIQLEIYGENRRDRKLVPVFSDERNQWLEIEEHEVVQLLIKDAPLNTIQQSDLDEVVDRQDIIQFPFVAKSPYRGLKRFNAKDKDLFFGRDRLIHKLIEAINQSNLLLVLGASGSGKSSVIRAGVIPQFESISTSTYQTLLFTPNRNPFVSLHRSLLDPSKDIFGETEVEFVAKGEINTLPRVVDLLKSQNSNWLIFIDQFEELFTICPNEETRSDFIQGLSQIAQAKDSEINLVLAMRSDFLEELSPYPQFAKLAQQHIHLVTDMQPKELRQAIEQPAAKHGVVFELSESDLVTEIIQDVQGQAGSLPLLQYTLDLLWQNDDLADRTLNISTYHQLGGVAGALQQRVNQIYEQLPQEQQLATKQILLRLIDVVGEEQVEVLRTAVSKRAYKSEFTPTQIETVAFLVDQNLLVSNDRDLYGEQQSTVEIAHEALLSSWAELKVWTIEAQETISLNNRLSEDAARWHDLKDLHSGKAQDELWGGSKLERAIEYRDNDTFELVLGGLSEQANNFIDASIAWRDRKIRAKLAAAQKLAQANEKAKIEAEKRVEEEKKANKILRFLLLSVTLGVVAGISAIGSVYISNISQIKEQAATLKLKLSLSNKTDHLLESMQLIGENQRFNQNWLKSKAQIMPEVQSALYQAVEKNREEYVFNDHTEDVDSVSFSPNGQYIVSASSDRTVKLWSAQDRSLLHTFSGHVDDVNSVSFSPDGQYIVSASNDKTVKLWSVKGSLLHTFSGHTEDVNSVSFSPDGQYIVSGSGKYLGKGTDTGNTIKLWSVKGSLLHTFKGHTDNVNSVSFSPDGQYIVSSSRDDTVKLWSVKGSLLHTFRGHTDDVNSVSFSPDGQYIVSGSRDNKVKLWSIENKSLFHTFSGHTHSVNSVSFSPDGQYVVSGSWDNTIKLWSKVDMSLTHTFYGHKDSVKSVSISSDSKHIVSGSRDNTVKLWSLENKSLVHTLSQNYGGHQDRVYPIAFSNDGKYLASGSKDETVKLWSLKNKSLIHTFDLQDGEEHQNRVYSVAFSPDGKYLASGSWDNTIKLWSVENKSLIHTFDERNFEDKHQVYSVAFSSDGKYLVSSNRDKTIKLWSLKDKSLVHTFEEKNGHQDIITSVAFSPDDKYLVSGSWDNTIKLWSLENKSLIHTFEGKNAHQDRVNSVAFSPDGKHIVSGSWDKTLKLWSVKNKSLVKTFNGHLDRVYSVAFSPNNQYIANQYIASGSWDNTIKLWSTQSQFPIYTFKAHKDGVYSVAFDSDGQYIASGGWDNTIKLWRGIKWQDWLTEGCEKTRLHPYLASGTRPFASDAAETCISHSNWSNNSKAELLVKQGLALASENGDLKNAKIKFDRAFELDKININVLELKTKARRLAAQNSVEQGKDKLKQGKIKQAIALYKKAQAIDPKLEIDADSWGKLCQSASLNDQPQSVLSRRSPGCQILKKSAK